MLELLLDLFALLCTRIINIISFPFSLIGYRKVKLGKRKLYVIYSRPDIGLNKKEIVEELLKKYEKKIGKSIVYEHIVNGNNDDAS